MMRGGLRPLIQVNRAEKKRRLLIRSGWQQEGETHFQATITCLIKKEQMKKAVNIKNCESFE